MLKGIGQKKAGKKMKRVASFIPKLVDDFLKVTQQNIVTFILRWLVLSLFVELMGMDCCPRIPHVIT